MINQQKNNFHNSKNETAQDFSNAIIKNQNNFYQSPQKSFKVLIDAEQINNWYINNSTNIDNLLHLFLDLKHKYAQNNNINVAVATPRLQSLNQKFENLKTFDQRNEILKEIKKEIEKCNQIKILLKIISIEALNVGCSNSIKIVLEILHSICNDPIDGRYPWEFSNDFVDVKNFLQEIEIINIGNNDIFKYTLKTWDQKNIYVTDFDEDEFLFGTTKEEHDKHRESFINSTKEELKIFTEEKIEKETTKFIEDFSREKFAIWTQLPFRCTFVFSNGIEFSIFNLYNKYKDKNKLYRNLLDKNNENNILSLYYSYLIFFVNFYKVDVNNLDYHFFSCRLKDIKYEYDALQLELQKIKLPYEFRNIDMYMDYRWVHDGWDEEMFSSYHEVKFDNRFIKL